MKTFRAVAPLILSAVLAACSSTDSAETAVASAEVTDPDEVSCRTIVKTGTRIGTRVCKTNRAWAASTASGRSMAESIQRTSGQVQTISGN